MRRAISRRMMEAWRNQPMVTLSRRVDVTALAAWRSNLAKPAGIDGGARRLMGRCLARHPRLNGTIEEKGLTTGGPVNLADCRRARRRAARAGAACRRQQVAGRARRGARLADLSRARRQAWRRRHRRCDRVALQSRRLRHRELHADPDAAADLRARHRRHRAQPARRRRAASSSAASCICRSPSTTGRWTAPMARGSLQDFAALAQAPDALLTPLAAS